MEFNDIMEFFDNNKKEYLQDELKKNRENKHMDEFNEMLRFMGEQAEKLATEGTKLKHYKGGEYTVIGRAKHSETLEQLIVYRSDKDNEIWVRPVSMFFEIVEIKREGLPTEVVSRFEIVKEG